MEFLKKYLKGLIVLTSAVFVVHAEASLEPDAQLLNNLMNKVSLDIDAELPGTDSVYRQILEF